LETLRALCGDASPTYVDASLDRARGHGSTQHRERHYPSMKLTLTTDDGRTNTINMEGELDPGERLKTMQQICVLLDQMAGKDLEEDKDNG
jgi:hypothetical protein